MASGIMTTPARLVKCSCGGFFCPKIEIQRDGRTLKNSARELRSARSRFRCILCGAVRHSAKVYAALKTGRMVIEYVAPFGFAARTYGEHIGYFKSYIEAEWGIEDYHEVLGRARLQSLGSEQQAFIDAAA